MKKLMFAVAALAAGVACAEITSANIVGYQGLAANATRNTMMAPTFLNVGSATGCKLSDLSVTGYDAPEWSEEDEGYEGGCSGDFSIQFLNNNGTVAARYYWVDDGEVGPAWCDKDFNPVDADSITIPAGVGMWNLGNGYTLQCAGQVNAMDVAMKANATRNTAMGNCMPTALKLSELTVTGYDAPEWSEEDEGYEGGCSGDFSIQLLNNNGTVAARYYWVDDGEVGPAWCDKDFNPVDADSITIPAGKGMWNLGNGLTLNIPSPISDVK